MKEELKIKDDATLFAPGYGRTSYIQSFIDFINKSEYLEADSFTEVSPNYFFNYFLKNKKEIERIIVIRRKE